MPPKGSSQRIALDKKWPRYADASKCSTEYKRAFTLFKEKHRSTLAFLLERISEWNLRRHSNELSSFSDARLSTLTRDIVDFAVDAYRFRALLPAGEALLMMHQRRRLVGMLYDILGQPRPAAVPAGVYTDNHAELFAPLLPGDSDYVRNGNGTRMDYVLEPRLSAARRADLVQERQQVIYSRSSRHVAPAVAVPIAPAAPAPPSTQVTMPTGRVYILGPKGLYLERVPGDAGGFHYRKIKPGESHRLLI